MQFVMENEYYTSMRTNIIFASAKNHEGRRRSLLEDDQREGVAYQELKQSVTDFIHYGRGAGFRYRSLLLVGPPKSGKSSLLLRICSQNPKITVFSLKVKDFVSTDISLFFSMARVSLAAIIIIEDMDSILKKEGNVFLLKRELMSQMRRIYSDNKYVRGTMMIIGESRYPWLLPSGVIEKYFPQQLCMQQPTKHAMVAQDKKKFEFPCEWIDEVYMRQMEDYKAEYIKEVNYSVTEVRRSKLSWFIELFAKIRSR